MGTPTDSRSEHTRWRVRAVVFASGTATMALQMCAVRLLAPAVGASSIVWATIIGLSLLAMSVGYVLGGRLADRRVDGATLARTLAVAAVLVAMVPLVAPVLLAHVSLGITSSGWADLIGSTVGFAVMFLAPALLLGVTPPYAIRLAMPRIEQAGEVAGRLYALSTLGSIIGTLLAALILVQWIGTRATLLGIAVVLLGAALVARGARPVVAAGHVDPVVPDVPQPAPYPSGDGVPPAAHATRGIITAALAGAIVFVEGTAMMATEMSIARLVAPFFGASHAVWAVIIATVMGSIALGSRLGGRLADRRPTLGALVVLLAASAGAVAALPFLAAPVMRLSTGGIDEVAVGTVVGSFLATMALLVVPVLLLGMVPPWVLRLGVPAVTRAGRTAGRLYALSTMGALVGTFASVLWLIPEVGTRRTMLLFAGALALLAVGLAWAMRDDRTPSRVPLLAAPAALFLVVALAFAPTGLIKPLEDARVLAEEESRYQFIQVVEDQHGRRLLQLNEGWAVHSIWNPDTVLTGGIWDHFLVLPSLLEHDDDAQRRGDAAGDVRMAVIGSAAGTAKRAYGRFRPGVHMTSVELDPKVTALGRRYFELEGVVFAADGRPFLARAMHTWDVIHVDAYRQPYIPFYLTTREFFELAHERLEDGGVLSINVGSTPEDPRINQAVAATMRDVFPLVARYRAETYNEVILAVKDDDVTLDELRERIRSSDLAVGDSPVFRGEGSTLVDDELDSHTLDERGELGRLFRGFADGMVQVGPDPGRVLTDDRAPVEWMTDRMIFGAAG